MQVEQRRWSGDSGWSSAATPHQLGKSAQLVFLFGGIAELKASGGFDLARSLYPDAHLFGCTTAGEIQATSVTQESVVMAASTFEHSGIATSRVRFANPEESWSAGERLIAELPADGLTHVFVLSDGLKANGSQLVHGATSVLPPAVTVTGGFAGDGDRLRNTYVWCDDEPEQSAAVAVGFYGEQLSVTTGVTGPWGPFGPDRLVTKSQGNVLYELDGRPALNVYKTYLGEYAAALPASGLLFPLLIHASGSDRCVLRALIGVDESQNSITFAGDVTEGSYARLMRGTIERLLGDTFEAATAVKEALGKRSPALSILVSCNGRRHVLKQRIEEELEAVDEVFGAHTALTGFYSYGEIGPMYGGGIAELHNETMTITTFSEN
jgi:hypothetical protein